MAVDEALLDGCAASSASSQPVTLRLYGWAPAALSLGRMQPPAHDPAELAAQGLDLVRRPTGGGAVLHDRERTYALVGRLGRPPFPGGVLATYERIALALAAGLGSLGVDARPARQEGVRARPSGLCFGDVSHHEITHGGRKLVGSAQLRRRGAFLQHGSILLREEPARAARAAGVPAPAAGRSVGIETVLGREVALPRIDEALVAAFERMLGAALHPGGLTEAESERAQQLHRDKYRSSGWTQEGRAP